MAQEKTVTKVAEVAEVQIVTEVAEIIKETAIEVDMEIETAIEVTETETTIVIVREMKEEMLADMVEETAIGMVEETVEEMLEEMVKKAIGNQNHTETEVTTVHGMDTGMTVDSTKEMDTTKKQKRSEEIITKKTGISSTEIQKIGSEHAEAEMMNKAMHMEDMIEVEDTNTGIEMENITISEMKEVMLKVVMRMMSKENLIEMTGVIEVVEEMLIVMTDMEDRTAMMEEISTATETTGTNTASETADTTKTETPDIVIPVIDTAQIPDDEYKEMAPTIDTETGDPLVATETPTIEFPLVMQEPSIPEEDQPEELTAEEVVQVRVPSQIGLGMKRC